MQPHSIAEHTEDNPFLLFPNEFILAETVETFFLPSFLAGQFALKSSRARAGIEHLIGTLPPPELVDAIALGVRLPT